ncbi:MAG: hypothetical protein CMI02_12665 [Oceanospirillaceae bacterium]|nr:hypothetical protein [Oceanospirillaceae bacterium]MBT12873.1 hypothetical protein [Oceanospirillaceae bacterium]|tara:strand:- start:104706 stop:105440 length:735 start_codon:yes stop_codon:yes gene_type:complete
MKKQILAIAVAAAAMVPAAHAERYFADNSVSVLGGAEFKLDGINYNNDDYAQTTYTIEHVSGYSWGGLFFFMDRDEGEDGWDASYSEFSPKVFLTKFDSGLVKTIHADFTLESGSNHANTANSGFTQDNYLWGFGADLNIPGMNYFSATYYYAVNDTTEDDHQLTLVYGTNWGNLAFEGYIDYSTGAEDHKASFNFNPQITYNIGPMVGYDNKLKVGVEVSSWHNKYGSEFDEDNVAAMVKMHF